MSGLTVVVEPDTLARRIRTWLRDNPDIAKDKYNATRGSVAGHCYVASEAYYHGSHRDIDVYCLSHDTGTHWFLRDDTTVVDLSIETPDVGDRIPYTDATHRAFITGYKPSKRACRVLDALDVSY